VVDANAPAWVIDFAIRNALRSRFPLLFAIDPQDLSGGISMARKTIFVSDLTGKTIDEKEAATVTIRYADARRGQVVLDVNANEVAELASKGTKQARRGRKPKSQS
jgi:hypothetical protein